MTIILAYLLIVIFFLTERWLRTGQAARRLEPSAFEQNSARRIGLAFFVVGLGLLAAPLLNFLRVGWISAALAGWIGLLVAGGGIALRAWANRALGRFYTRTLGVAGDQVIVQTGPYRRIRHPGYLGTILLWCGAALATLNWIAVLIAVVVMFAVYAYRIQVEERMLLSTFGEAYRQYRARTWRLIPFIF